MIVPNEVGVRMSWVIPYQLLHAGVPPRSTVPHGVCKAVFREIHCELIQYLDFDTIYPLLMNHGLLRVPVDYRHFVTPENTQVQKIDMIISLLSNCNKKSDYLTPFIDCLKESVHHAPNHAELVKAMEKCRDKLGMF